MEQLKDRADYTRVMMPDGLVMLEGTTVTCPNCKAIAPFIAKLQKKYPELQWYEYDVDTADDIAHELGATHVPSFTLFKDGMKVDGVTGAKSEALERLVRENYEGNVVE